MFKTNYTIEIYACAKDRFWLEISREFYSKRNIEEITYWKHGKCITIKKYDPDEIKSKSRK